MPRITLGIFLAFLGNLSNITSLRAQELVLPASGTLVQLSSPFNPPSLKGIKIYPNNPFRFDFVLDKGEAQANLSEESRKLTKYFLASLTVPEEDLWVNLSPYEKDRIVPESFGQTEMGRDLLAQDYMLKQVTASLMYPEQKIGMEFWKKVYAMAAKQFGVTNVPMNAFNKVWIAPDKAVIFENAELGVAYIVESKLKVMLEADYVALTKNKGDSDGKNDAAQIVRDIIIPQLTREVNEGKTFAQLRQIYQSLILSVWYKQKIKNSILSQAYANKNKIAGIQIDDPRQREKIYHQYLKAFKKGAYDYIKLEQDPITRKTMPRRHFSGGAIFNNQAMITALTFTKQPPMLNNQANLAMLAVDLEPVAATNRSSVLGEQDIQGLFPRQSQEFYRGLSMWLRRGSQLISNTSQGYQLPLSSMRAVADVSRRLSAIPDISGQDRLRQIFRTYLSSVPDDNALKTKLLRNVAAWGREHLNNAAMLGETTNEFKYSVGLPVTSLTALGKDAGVWEKLLNEIKGHLLFNLGAAPILRSQEIAQPLEYQWISPDHVVLTFDTPLRNIRIDIDMAGPQRIIQMQFTVNWDTLGRTQGEDVTSAFDNVLLRQIEAEQQEFKNSIFVAELITQALGTTFHYQSAFFGGKEANITAHEGVLEVDDDVTTLRITLPPSITSPPNGYVYSDRNPVFVIVENVRSNIGKVKELLPAMWDEKGLHILMVGFQGHMTISDIFSFRETTPETWPIGPIEFRAKSFTPSKMQSKKNIGLELKAADMDSIDVAPMVRGSTLGERVFRYRLGFHSAYTEMVGLGLLNVPTYRSLESNYAHVDWLAGFGRVTIAEEETDTTFQVMGPHYTADQPSYDAFFGTTERTVHTFVRTAIIAQKMGFNEFNINMCCPVILMGVAKGGMGMDRGLARAIIEGLHRQLPDLKVTAKILLPSAVSGGVDLPEAIRTAKDLEAAGLARLIIQAQILGSDIAYPDVVREIAGQVHIPITYNGKIVTRSEEDLHKLGFDSDQYYSVEGLQKYFENTRVDRYMLGRVLLSGPWLFPGEDYGRGQILALALEQAKILEGVYHGMGDVGLMYFKLHLNNQLRYLRGGSIQAQHILEEASSVQEIIGRLTELVAREGKDPAMTDTSTGGIELNPRHIQMDVVNAGRPIALNVNPAMILEMEKAAGLVPVKITIDPGFNLRLFLGLPQGSGRP